MARGLANNWIMMPLASLGTIFILLYVVPIVFALQSLYLWTDIFIFILMAMVFFLVSYIRSKEHLLRPWKAVFRRKMAMASAVLLSAFILVGMLDSIHFRLPLSGQAAGPVQYSVEVSSLLDVITRDIHVNVEKTYSAPFATHLFSKESIDLPGGGSRRVYPRLKYGGAHLADPETEKQDDILFKLFSSFWQGVVIWGVLVALFMLVYSFRKGRKFSDIALPILKGQTSLPLRTAGLTVLVIVLMIMFVINAGTAYHVFGTDKVGQDVLYQSLKSIRTGLVIGTLTTMVMLPFALMMGVAAGYYQGWVDDVIQYIYTTLSSIPSVLLIAAAILSIQVYISNHQELFGTSIERADLRLLALCFILGITSWTSLCRLLRGEAFKLRELEYIQAAKSFGVRHVKIISRHIVPNIMHIVLIVVVLDFSGLVLAEAVLSYVGVGVDPSTDSWGNMINGARLEMAREPMVWWSLMAAFSFMFILVLAANLFSDAVRDAFDPHQSSA